jgi:type VII secretion-associated serine protease mycosin
MGDHRRWNAVAAALVSVLVTMLATAILLVPASPGWATPAGCVTTPPAGGDLAAVPWTMRWSAPERLTSLATGRGITVAVVDSGVDAGHPQLRGRVAPGEDALAGGDGRVDCVGHGTAVASIIAAQPLPGVALRGLAPDATILPVRVSEQESVDGGTAARAVGPAGLALAVRHAVDRGARVLNLSIVLYRDEPAVRDAIRYAVDHDVVVVAAVGNAHDQRDPTPYPAAYDGVLGVGAIRPDGTRWPGSQVGPYVDLVAPGGEVPAAVPGHGYAVYEGTSFAVPFVAATAALVREYRPELSARDVGVRLTSTADPAPGNPHSPGYGYGVVNPYRAVTEPLAASATRPAAAALPMADHHPKTTADRHRALTAAATGALAAAVLALAGSALPRGRRRRWRAG